MNINLVKGGRDGFNTMVKPRTRTGFEINGCLVVLGNKKLLGADHFFLSGCSITNIEKLLEYHCWKGKAFPSQTPFFFFFLESSMFEHFIIFSFFGLQGMEFSSQLHISTH